MHVDIIFIFTEGGFQRHLQINKPSGKKLLVYSLIQWLLIITIIVVIVVVIIIINHHHR